MTTPSDEALRKAATGSVRLPASKPEWLPLLRGIYEYESFKLSGPGSARFDIKDALWTVSQLSKWLGVSQGTQGPLDDLIHWLVENRHAMQVEYPDGSRKYLTRVAETVRLLGHTPEYWHRGRASMDAVRWLVEYKSIPARTITLEQFEASLAKAIEEDIVSRWQPNLKSSSTLVLRKVAEYLAQANKLSGANAVRFSRFQLDSTLSILKAEFGSHRDKPAQIITAGVGSGKTFAFLIPILISSLARIKGGESERRTSLLIYPRKALATNQADIVREVVDQIGVPALSVHFEHYDGYQDNNESVKQGLQRVYGSIGPPPAIIVTTLETLKRRLQHPLFIGKVAQRLQRVALDEVHLIEGLGGSHVVRLMDRLRTACQEARPGETLLWTASSATVASPHVHAAMIFGLKSRDVEVIQPSQEDMQSVGIAHHVFLRPTTNISTLGALVNATSVIVHNRRADVGTRSEKGDLMPKTIAFADNLDMLGRWNADLRENERTEEVEDRPHPSSGDRLAWKPERQREVPYALRFSHPLDARIKAEGGKGEGFPAVLQEFRGEAPSLCERCKSGERVSLGIRTAKEVNELSKLVIKRPQIPSDSVKTFYIRNASVFDGKAQEIGTMDLCPYLRAGACFWFPIEGEAVEPIPKTSSSRHEWKSVARSRIHTAKTAKKSDEAEDLADIVFMAPVSEVYDVRAAQPGEIPIDIVLASPSLEVGIDLKNVTESIMFHAIRNVASYRQKAGRIGREEGSDSLNTTLVANRRIDLHFYRQPRKLVSLAQLDPIPLKDTNVSTLRTGVYLAIWDWLCLKAKLPEVVTLNRHDGGWEFTYSLEESLKKFKTSRPELAKYLSVVSRDRFLPDSSEIQEALDQVGSELAFLLTDTKDTLANTSKLSDMIPMKLDKHSPLVRPSQESTWLLQDLSEHTRDYRSKRSKIDPLSLGLQDAFERLDIMANSGWILENLELSTAAIKQSAAGLEGRQRRLVDEVLHHLERIRELLSDAGTDALSLTFYQQFDDFADRKRPMAYYLSYILSEIPVFRVFRKKPEFVRIEYLFTNPYEEEVEVQWEWGGRKESATLSEALYSLIPGTWNYRYGRKAVKVKTGLVSESEGGVLLAKYERLKGAGNEFVSVKEDVQGPAEASRGFTVVRPTTLRVLELRENPKVGSKEKYVRMNPSSGRVIDGDETPFGGESEDRGRLPYVKVPKSYLNRWVNISSSRGTPIGVLDQDTSRMSLLGERGQKLVEGSDATSRIRHPLEAAFFKGVYWHDRLDVTEFVYSCSRSYTSTSNVGVEVVFAGPSGEPMAFGHSIETEGLSMELEPTVVEAVKDEALTAMAAGSREWGPTMVKGFAYYLMSAGMEEENHISVYVARDLVGALYDFQQRSGAPLTPKSLVEQLGRAVSDEGGFRKSAGEFYSEAVEIESEDDESFRLDTKGYEKDKVEVDAKVERLVAAAKTLAPRASGFEGSLGNWLVATLLNSLGAAASNALQRFAGVTDDVVGYAVDYKSMKSNEYKLYLYDKDIHGSGSTATAEKFFHILHIQRHGETLESSFLPSDDFLTVLEEELLQCPQHHTDLSALQMLFQRSSGGEPKGIEELGYVRKQANEVFDNVGETWKNLGITGRAEASLLPLQGMRVNFLAKEKHLEPDNLLRATTICWNGCPECLINREAVMGGPLGETLLDKMVLDEWFRLGRKRSKEYFEVNLAKLASCEESLPFGRLSEVVIDLEHRRVRSVSLPYTIGVEVPRDPSRPPHLVLRSSDIEGLSLFEQSGIEPAHGIESLGFKRLLWHDLILTSYLDLLGLFPAGRRSVQAVFYDCRDIGFEDIGVSPRMLDAILEQSKDEGGMGVPQRLSDILTWLSRRGFRVEVCVDKNRLEEEGVRDFLKRLNEAGCNVVSKDLPGLMHKKAIVTPLGAIKGSANLTTAGTRANEEMIDYAGCGTQAYKEISTAVRDTFQGARHV